MCLYTIVKIDFSAVDVYGLSKELICDKDPSVMGASLNIFSLMCKSADTIGFVKKITTTFVDILNQIIENKLSSDFIYHKLPGKNKFKISSLVTDKDFGNIAYVRKR
jgi:hypothetical protein